MAHLKLVIAKLRHDQYGASSERGRKLIDQMELELEELEAGAAEDAAVVAHSDAGSTNVHASQACAGPVARTLAARAGCASRPNRMPLVGSH